MIPRRRGWENAMIEYARLTPGPGFHPGRAALYYAQRLVTPPGLRRVVSQAIAAGIRLRHGGGAERADDPAAGRTIAALRRDGLAVLPEPVPGTTVDRIVAFLRGSAVLTNAGLTPLDGLSPAAAAAAYPLAAVLACPDVVDLINAPMTLRIAAGYLGCKPTLSSLGVRWSFPSSGPAAETQRFHRDPDDWRFLKLFVYLTDVDAGSGPHVFALGSHRTGGDLRARFHEERDLERRYGRGSLRTVVGPRGTAFLADTHGIHRGARPGTGPRLILQAQYSLLPVYALRYRPVALPARPPVDTYVNRLLIA